MQYEARTSQEPAAEKTSDVEDRLGRAPAAQARSVLFQRQDLGQRYQQTDQFIREILVPTDFSSCSARALDLAVSLAQQCQANLTILHVIDINAQSANGECLPAMDLMKRLWETGSGQMGELAWSLNGQVDAQTVVEEGLPWEEIVDKSRQVDLVILGKPDTKPGRKLFSKHTAQRVIDNAACPVVVVQDRD